MSEREKKGGAGEPAGGGVERFLDPAHADDLALVYGLFVTAFIQATSRDGNPANAGLPAASVARHIYSSIWLLRETLQPGYRAAFDAAYGQAVGRLKAQALLAQTPLWQRAAGGGGRDN